MEKIYKENLSNRFMNFIKKIFLSKPDESVHLQFQKFGRGEFRYKALITAKKTGNKYTITTTSEFANELVRKMAEKLGDDKTEVTGAVVSTNNLKEELNFKEIKQFQGVKRYLIEENFSGREIISLLNKFPKAFFALSFETGNSKLKIKPKAPKSPKPKNKEEKPKPDFCKIITDDRAFAEDFVFEKPEFKKAEIVHHFIINDLTKPKGETDFSRIRELAKRKGKIVREAEIDEKKTVQEKDFEA